MKGLSITAIGLRQINECLNIFHTLRHPLNLDYLELAIGSKCDVELNYDNIPLIIHDSCLYKHHYRCKLNPLQPSTWYSYTEFINNHHVLAVSIHPPLKKILQSKRSRNCSVSDAKSFASTRLSRSNVFSRILLFLRSHVN